MPRHSLLSGSYRAISGGHVEEAFLDLTGSPTAVYTFDDHDFNPRQFWADLMTFRSKRLPMGCGTSSSQGGIVGMHAYSILDVREVRDVGLDFFRDKLARGTLGGVSGFTEFDGTVRLLRIRNPHGQGEWKGEFSDRSPIWERLMANKNERWNESNAVVDLTSTAPQSPELKRTMVNDGTFWIDYDSFLMGFSNVDVVRSPPQINGLFTVAICNQSPRIAPLHFASIGTCIPRESRKELRVQLSHQNQQSQMHQRISNKRRWPAAGRGRLVQRKGRSVRYVHSKDKAWGFSRSRR